MLVIKALISLLPWPLRRLILVSCWGYRFGRGARLGWCSFVYPVQLTMGPGAQIGSLTVVINCQRLEMGAESIIGRGNWITGHPRGSTAHYFHLPGRDPSLVLGEHAAITKNHHIDATDLIEIGAFTTVAGYGSQLLCHSIDLRAGRQHARPITIGRYCFISTRVVLLGGVDIPDRSVVAAGAVVVKPIPEPGGVWGGVPAERIGTVGKDWAYCSRTCGFVA